MKRSGKGRQPRAAEWRRLKLARSTWQALARRQNLLHASIALTGACTLAAGILMPSWFPTERGLSLFLAGEGLAFIMVGIVGTVMSLATQDIAQGIRDAIRDDGIRTRRSIRGMKNAIRMEGELTRKAISGMRGDLGLMLEKQDRMLEKQDRMLEKQDRMLEKQDRMLDTQNRLLERQNQIGDALGRLLEAQNRILEKIS